MRRTLLACALALPLVAAACGGGSKPLAETARPCLSKLGVYVHHRPVPRTGVDTTPTLPVLDPDNPPRPGLAPGLPWPADFEEYGEVSYPPSGKGANAVQVLIFGDDELPPRIAATMRKPLPGGTFFSRAPAVEVRGRTLVLWSSTPTPRQRAAVDACLET
jgi:hypothetical protein